MKIFGFQIGRNFEPEQRDFEATVKSEGDAVGDVIKALLADDSITTERADQGWAHISVAKIAQIVSSIQWRVLRENNEGAIEEVDGNVVNDFLYKPNKTMTFTKFVYRLVGQREFTGIVPVRIKSVPREGIRAYVLDSTRVKAKWDDEGLEITKYEYTKPNGQMTTLSVDEVKIFFIPDFFDFKGAAGKVEKIKDWLLVDRATTELQKEMAKNRSYVGGVLETGATTQEQIKKTKDMFNQKTSDRGEDLILPKDAKYTRFNLNAKEMEVTAQDEAHAKKILKAFGVSKEILGDVEGKGRANVEGAYYGFIRFVIVPILEDLREFLNEEIVPTITGEEGVYVDFENPLPEDKEFDLKRKEVSTGKKGWLTVNEVRAEEGLEPIDGGDEIGSPAPMLLSVKKAEQRVLQKRVPSSVRYRKRTHARKVEKMQGILERKEFNNIGEVLREALHKDFIARMTEMEKKEKAIFVEHAKDLEKEVLKKVSDKKKAKGDVEYFDVEKEADSLYVRSAEILDTIAVEEGLAQYGLIENPVGEYDPNDKKLRKAMKNMFMLRATSYNATTLKILNKEIQEGIKEGETAKQLKKRVQGVFENVPKYRAQTLAQDIVFSTANRVTRSAYEQSEVVQKLVWHTAQDELVCDFCASMHGKTIGIEENFFNKGDKLEVNGNKLDLDFEDIAHPPIHAGCRCWVLPEEISF